MVTHIRAAAAPRRAPPTPPHLLQNRGPICSKASARSRTRTTYVVHRQATAPDLMCALLRAGATQVTHLCPQDRPEAASASLVIVPQVASLGWLAGALPSIRRALIANGRLVVSVATDTAPHTIPDPPHAGAARLHRDPHAQCRGPPSVQCGAACVRSSSVCLKGATTMRIPISGVGGSLTALATPFRQTRVDWDALSRLAERQIPRGTRALVVCGSTGEAAALSQSEYARAMHTWWSRPPSAPRAGDRRLLPPLHLGGRSPWALKAATAGVTPCYAPRRPTSKPNAGGHLRAYPRHRPRDGSSRSCSTMFRRALAWRSADDTVARLHASQDYPGRPEGRHRRCVAAGSVARPLRRSNSWRNGAATTPLLRPIGPWWKRRCISVIREYVAAGAMRAAAPCLGQHPAGPLRRAPRFARSAARGAVRGKQSDPVESRAGQPWAVHQRGPVAADPCRTGDAGKTAGSDGAGDAGGKSMRRDGRCWRWRVSCPLSSLRTSVRHRERSRQSPGDDPRLASPSGSH